jgi:hypothetical protein
VSTISRFGQALYRFSRADQPDQRCVSPVSPYYGLLVGFGSNRPARPNRRHGPVGQPGQRGQQSPAVSFHPIRSGHPNKSVSHHDPPRNGQEKARGRAGLFATSWPWNPSLVAFGGSPSGPRPCRPGMAKGQHMGTRRRDGESAQREVHLAIDLAIDFRQLSVKMSRTPARHISVRR